MPGFGIGLWEVFLGLGRRKFEKLIINCTYFKRNWKFR